MIIFGVITLVLAVGYTLLMRHYLVNWERLPDTRLPKDFIPNTRIEIIIPARNEAINIQKCLDSLLLLDYPRALYHITLVDDFSEDDTLTSMQKYASEHISILQMKDIVADVAQSNKKTAIASAIKASHAALIVTSDADCTFPTYWLHYFAYKYEVDHSKIIAAPVLFPPIGSSFQRFQALDYGGMMGITGGCIYSRHMYMCNGANLAYDRKIFHEVNGFHNINHIASGDDMLLMQKIAINYPQDISFIKSNEAIVYSQPMATIGTFLHQRLRWASKSGHYQQWWIDIELILVWLYCVSIPLALVLSFFNYHFGILFFTLLFIKTITDFRLLRATTTFFGQQSLMKIFFVAQFYHLFYIIIIGILRVMSMKSVWKGRK